jgi:hypothetical protein
VLGAALGRAIAHSRKSGWSHRPAPKPKSVLVRFFTLADPAVGAIAVLASDEGRCAHALGIASAGIGRKIADSVFCHRRW